MRRVDDKAAAVDFVAGVVKAAGSEAPTPLDGRERYWRLMKGRMLDAGDKAQSMAGDTGRSRPRTPLTYERKARRKELLALAKESLRGKPIDAHGMSIAVTTNGIKEFLDQPFPNYAAKNESVLRLPQMLSAAEPMGTVPNRKDNPHIRRFHVYKTHIEGQEAFLLVREMTTGEAQFYSVIDKDPTLYRTKKP